MLGIVALGPNLRPDARGVEYLRTSRRSGLIGQYYTGDAMNLVFANDDDAGVGSNSRFSNVKIVVRPNYLYFNAVSTSLYSNQQQTGVVSVGGGNPVGTVASIAVPAAESLGGEHRPHGFAVYTRRVSRRQRTRRTGSGAPCQEAGRRVVPATRA